MMKLKVKGHEETFKSENIAARWRCLKVKLNASKSGCKICIVAASTIDFLRLEGYCGVGTCLNFLFSLFTRVFCFTARSPLGELPYAIPLA